MFRDRADAGRQLAAALQSKALPDPVVLALPRGGVPVAAEVARQLNAPLDLLLVRKIGAPHQPELAVAAVAEGGALAINEDVLAATGTTHGDVESRARLEVREIERRRMLYMKGRPPVPVAGRSAIVIDDGIATGATMRAALRLLRERRPARIVLAIPVAPADTLALMRPLVDDLVCLHTPRYFHAVGAHYVRFDQVEDAEVIDLMKPLSPPEPHRH
ncbi:MAG: phosphoribosyltransferase family protein [Aquincola sp.]|nr:phosphoribosyltransferase family protein [Aquincola sp.]MDH4288341.1 phosphoribosyltransferase family protein [Aquincola sp.]MDH5328957.1 phosphoribosyltransferase family protein [Aquincola sp.]